MDGFLGRFMDSAALALSLLSAALSTAAHCNILRNSKYEADGERSREDFESDKLSCWGPMGAVEL